MTDQSRLNKERKFRLVSLPGAAGVVYCAGVGAVPGALPEPAELYCAGVLPGHHLVVWCGVV